MMRFVWVGSLCPRNNCTDGNSRPHSFHREQAGEKVNERNGDFSPTIGVECFRMNRPKGLALTAWLMVALSTLGWSVIDWNGYRNPVLHSPRATFVSFIAVIVTMKICGLVCIWYYFQGRNWARIAVLLALDDIFSASAKSRERGVPQRYCERSAPRALLSLLVEHSQTSQIFPVGATLHQVTKSGDYTF
jgi:hypothetical protein